MNFSSFYPRSLHFIIISFCLFDRLASEATALRLYTDLYYYGRRRPLCFTAVV